jgi:PKD repeat protein
MDNPSKRKERRILKGKSSVIMLFAAVCLYVALLYPQFKTCSAQSSTLKLVDVMLDYGNGTRRWASCILQLGDDTVYNATQLVATSLNVTWYDGSAFVDAIDDVWNSYPFYWMWWYWDSSESRWVMGPVACNLYILEDCDIIAWYYEDCSVWPPSPPPNPPVTRVDILLDYGNGTRIWRENVEVLGFASVLKATKTVASVEYSLWWGTDAFVDAINNVWNDYVSWIYFWISWHWNHTAECWEMIPVACNKYLLTNGDIIAWYYEDCTVWPMEPPASTPHPVARFTWTPVIPKVNEHVIFDASASTPNGGTIVKYAWDFGDGNTAYGKIVSHSYANSGTFTVTLNVSDSNGLWDIEQKQITVVRPSSPKADFKAVPETAKVGEKIKFDASASLPGWNGTHSMTITEYRWNFGDGNITVTSQPVVYHSYGAAGNYYVTLTVYSPGATPETDSATVRVTVFAVPVGGQSVPAKTPQTETSLETYVVLVAIITATFTVVRRNLAKR